MQETVSHGSWGSFRHGGNLCTVASRNLCHSPVSYKAAWWSLPRCFFLFACLLPGEIFCSLCVHTDPPTLAPHRSITSNIRRCLVRRWKLDQTQFETSLKQGLIPTFAQRSMYGWKVNPSLLIPPLCGTGRSLVSFHGNVLNNSQ